MPNNQIDKINGNFKNKDILSIDQFSPTDLDILFKLTAKMKDIAMNGSSSDILAGKLVVLLFYEPSSRTLASFSAAIKKLGGQTVVIRDPQHFSSVSKGETFEDTVRTFEAYSNAIVLRHPQVGAAQTAADTAIYVPVINAGDGIGEHPTQALLDTYTIYEKFGRLNNLTGILAGDLLNGRTIKSLIRALSLYENNTFYLLSPKELQLGRSEFSDFKKRGVNLIEITSEKDMPKNADFWYWTRVQKERFGSMEEYEKVKNKFVVSNKLIKEFAGEDTIIMHPLPRVGEIETDVDKDPRAVYLRSQIRNGMYVRMALISLILGKE